MRINLTTMQSNNPDDDFYFKSFTADQKFFTIKKNNYLSIDVRAFRHCEYKGYKSVQNPNFILAFKNLYSQQKEEILQKASSILFNILCSDFESFFDFNYGEFNKSNLLMVCVPRSRAENELMQEQKVFRETVKKFALSHKHIGDGTSAIIRTKSTQTTHLSRSNEATDGASPYVGITKDTCRIDKDMIQGKTIILVDDIYTKSVNVIEDCIQALLDNGAYAVFVYVVAETVHGEDFK